MAELEVGQQAPAFELPCAGGGTFNLSEHHGKRVVVYFYPKDDTSSCTTEATNFSDLAGGFARAGVAVVGISPDSLRSHDRFKEKYGLAVALGSDVDRRVIDAYGVWGEKQMYGRTYMGVERATFLVGKDGRIERIWRNVRVKGHAEEVLAAAAAP